MESGPPSDSYTYSSSGHAWRLAAEIVLLGDSCRDSECRGAWRLVVRVPHQVVWKRVSPSGSRAAPGNNIVAVALITLDMRGLQGFGDISKVSLLVFLELWLKTYPVSCGSG